MNAELNGSSMRAVDERFMARALELALRGVGQVNPNPLVGCIIVRDGCIVGEGWHTAFGKLHAEREALANCTARGADARGACAYVTLEPCCHTGKTPPCTDALIEAGVARVVVGASDPNPLVAGRGCSLLREAGIQVDEGVLADRCMRANEVFFHYIQAARPFVIAKYAMTLDGKTATYAGQSRWITGTVARRRVHEDRNRYAAVMVGVDTVIADDPELTCRLGEFGASSVCALAQADGVAAGACKQTPGAAKQAFAAGEQAADEVAGDCAGRRPFGDVRNPVRIVCDTHLRTPLSARVVKTAREVPTIIATCESDGAVQDPYLAAGCEVVTVRADARGHVDLDELMAALGARGIDGIVVEGGGELLAAAFSAGIVNKVQAYVAPKIFGGRQAPSAVGGCGVETPADAVRLSAPRVTSLGDDVLLECDVLDGGEGRAV